VRDVLARVPLLRAARASGRALSAQFGLGPRPMGGVAALSRFAVEFARYRELAGARGPFELSTAHLLPCLLDRTDETPIEPIYFVQDTWFARRLASRRPAAHVDVGSSAKTMAILAQFVPVTMVDIRPVPIHVPGFTFVEGSALSLPFADASISSLSSLCVVEHIGLGRYGDPLDARGSEKALLELRRVLAPGGDLYLSVPVDRRCRVYFNAHRAFTRDYLLECCEGLEIVEEAYLYGRELLADYQPERGFGTILLHLRKP